MYVSVRERVWVCVCERERERGREGECVCVCETECVRESERERERERGKERGAVQYMPPHPPPRPAAPEKGEVFAYLPKRAKCLPICRKGRSVCPNENLKDLKDQAPETVPTLVQLTCPTLALEFRVEGVGFSV